MKSKLNNRDIKRLVDAYDDVKKAEAVFKDLRERLCSNLVEGEYRSEYGSVLKTLFHTKTFDKKMFESERPDIDLEKYCKEQERTRITITKN